MPESGGGYFFVSRALGTLPGCMVGIGQWLGLVFASAFYLMGFGHYLSDLLHVLSSLRVVLLGWFSVPEQTSPAQARDQFGAEAEATLDEVARRFEAAGAEVTLLHILEGEETVASSREDVLEPAAEMMRDHGIKADLLELDSVAADDPVDTIVDWAEEHDLAVLGETKPSVREILFGTVPERIVTSINIPVIVVRHEDEEVDAAEQGMQASSS